MQITAEFITSATNARDFPRDRLPEIALVGRSNVGKSSLINALVRRPLARTSGAPGKTRLVKAPLPRRPPGLRICARDQRHLRAERARCRRGGKQRIDRGVFRTAGRSGGDPARRFAPSGSGLGYGCLGMDSVAAL